MTKALIVWADERARIGQLKTKLLRAVREWVGHCENCGATEKLTVHHTGKHWFFDIVVYCKECHSFWHWLTDPKRGTSQPKKKKRKVRIINDNIPRQE